MTCLLIGEQLLHGYDLAQAVGAEWLIETEPARLVVQALLPILPAFVDDEAAKGVDATYELAVTRWPPCHGLVPRRHSKHRPTR